MRKLAFDDWAPVLIMANVIASAWWVTAVKEGVTWWAMLAAIVHLWVVRWCWKRWFRNVKP